jgi:signal transduction histidine kinase/predicted RNA-binding protein with RPS1 domain/DNA-binding response OmpR family regulator
MVASRSSAVKATEALRTSSREEAWQSFIRHYHEGDVIIGFVHRMKSYGVFVEIIPGQDGLVHRSEIIPGQVVEIEDHLWPGDQVRAVIQRIDRSKKRIHLSIADYLYQEGKKTADKHSTSHLTSDSGSTESGIPLLILSSVDPDQYEAETQRMFEAFDVQPKRIRDILLVEDQSDLRNSLVTLLQEAGYLVTVLEDAAAASQLGAAGRYDLILLDAHTPEADGIEAAVEILEKCPGDRVVLMTGIPLNQEELQRLASVAPVAVLQKPLLIRDLEALLTALETGSEIRWQPEQSSVGSSTVPELGSFSAASKQDLCSATKQILGQLKVDTGASAAAVFGMNLVTRQAELLCGIGIDRSVFEQRRSELDISPVKDVIVDDEHIFETDAIDRMPAKFKYLLLLLEFRACVGIPLTTAGNRRFGLFIFHESPAHFNSRHKQHAYHTASALNALIERYQVERALRTTQEFSTLGQLSAGLAHEVNNRISALEAQVQLLKRYSQSIGVASTADKILQPGSANQLQTQLSALSETVSRLRQTAFLFQQLVSPQKGRVCHPSTAIQRAVGMLLTTARKSRVRVDIGTLPKLPLVHANDIALEQVLINLILNSIQQIREQGLHYGWVRVAASMDGTDAMLPVQISVADNGPGIHRQWWERVFDLGFSTRPNGSGLGLFVARSLVESFGGELYIAESAMLTGTTFVVALPTEHGREKG